MKDRDVGETSGETSSSRGRGIETGVVQLVEEVARVDKHRVVTGRVRVSTRTDTVEQTVRDTLKSQAVEVARVALDRMLLPGEPIPQVRTEGDVTVIPVVEEVLVVEKRLVLKEELRVTRRVDTGVFEEVVPLRQQSAVIEQLDPDANTFNTGE